MRRNKTVNELPNTPSLYKEVMRSDWDKALAKIEQQAREIERLNSEAIYAASAFAAARQELAALKAQSGGVVLPERDDCAAYEAFYIERAKTLPLPLGNAPLRYSGGQYINDFALFGWMVWEACLSEVARLNSSPVSAGWMLPTAQQLEQALESVPSLHDLSAELIAPAMLEHLREVISAGEYGDAYQGARQDLLIWKHRALEAETKVREQDQVIENLGNALNAESGPTFMGEPVMPVSAGEPDCDRSACGDFSPGPCDNHDCPARRDRKQVSAGVVDDRAAFDALLNWAEQQVCTHESTHRGGSIWETCDDCGGQWADDRGGKPAFLWPDEIVKARAALSANHSEQVRASAPELSASELESLLDFHRAICCDSGHTLSKSQIGRLVEVGAIQCHGFGKHSLTEFGVYLLANAPSAGSQKEQGK